MKFMDNFGDSGIEDFYEEELGLIQASAINFLSSEITEELEPKTKADLIAFNLCKAASTELQQHGNMGYKCMELLMGLVG
jgi:hypothetical protein